MDEEDGKGKADGGRKRKGREPAAEEEDTEVDTAVERAARWQALEAVLGARVPEAPARGSIGAGTAGKQTRAGAPAAVPATRTKPAGQTGGRDDFAAKMRERIQQKQAEARARAVGEAKP